MDEQLKAKLKEWAGIYNVRSFIPDDPVQFPHRFTEKRDIEISAFITSWISYGRRELILARRTGYIAGWVEVLTNGYCPADTGNWFRMSQPANAIRFIAFIRIRTSVPL